MAQFPEANIKAVKDSLIKFGITNPYVQNGILAVVGKESEFIPSSEKSYRNTSNARIRQVFGTRLADLTDAQLTILKANDINFFDKVYGSRYGNNFPEDAYKYRGRGFNQITFKNLYELYGKKIGVDLIKNPDALNTIPVAADALAVYFRDQFKIGKDTGLLKDKIGVEDISEIKDLETATKAAVQANAGWKTNFNNAVVQEGFKKALQYVTLFPLTIGMIPLPIITTVAKVLQKKKSG